MSEPARHWVSVDEYLYQEEQAEFKSEYFNGEVFAMAGGTAEHNLISVNLIRELANQLEERPGQVYGSDQQRKMAGSPAGLVNGRRRRFGGCELGWPRGTGGQRRECHIVRRAGHRLIRVPARQRN